MHVDRKLGNRGHKLPRSTFLLEPQHKITCVINSPPFASMISDVANEVAQSAMKDHRNKLNMSTAYQSSAFKIFQPK